MSSARIPGSLRRPAAKPHNVTKIKRDTATTTGIVTAACLAAASPASIALAQGTPSGPLPPLSVEANQPKKKAPSAPAKKAGTAAPAPAPAPAPAMTPAQKSANPYANPNAPYKVEQSASPKLTEPLVNTPKTITAVPKEVLQDTATTTIRELAREVPGVTLGFAEGGNAFGDRIYIRGFDARGDIYVDNIRDPGNTSRETFAVEQIEIYKGPTGVVAGRGTAGGALNIITKKPYDDRNFYNLSTMIGTDGTRRVTADVNQVITPGVAFRGNLLYHESGVAGRNEVEDERWGGAFALAVKPSESFKVTVDYYRLRTDGLPDFGVPLNINAKVPWAETGLSRDLWFGNAMRDFMKNESDILTTAVELKLSDAAKVTSRTRVGTNSTDYVASGPTGTNGPNVTMNNPQRFQEADLVANQTDVTLKFHTGGWHHTLVAGVEASKEEIGRYSYTGLASATQPLFNPNPYRGLTNPALNNVGPRTWTYDATISTVAGYILDTVKLSEQWYINGGIRVDDYERAQVAPTAANTATRQDTLVNWHAGIVFKPIPIASIYAAYATSMIPAGAELDATGVDYGGLALNVAHLPPEEVTSVEVGTKWELFNRRLLATAALFQTEKENGREAAVAPSTQITATGAYRVRGVELGAQGKVTERWSVYGGLVVMETEVTASSTPRFVGRRIANVPETQFSLLSKYQLTDKLTIGGQAIYASDVLAGLFAAGDQGYYLPSHWRFDALAEYKLTDNISMQLNVLNLTDEVYYDAVYRSASPFVFIAPGRAGYLTVNFKY